jgi:hypothetical protein
MQVLKFFRTRSFLILAVVLGVGLAWEGFVRLLTEGLWFIELGYLGVWLLQLSSQVGIGLGVGAIGWLFLRTQLRQAHHHNQHAATQLPKDRPWERWELAQAVPPKPRFGFAALLTTSLAAAGVIMTLGLLYGQAAVALSPSPSIHLLRFCQSGWEVGQRILLSQQGLLLVLLGGIGLLLWRPSSALAAGAVGFSGLCGYAFARQWSVVLAAFHAQPFGQTDPLFHHDIGAYVFWLPLAELVEFWSFGLALYALTAVGICYLLAHNSLSDGVFWGFSRSQRRHLYQLGGIFLAIAAVGHWLSRYQLLYSPRGVAYGASFTEVVVQLPIETGFSLITAAMALYCGYRMVRLRAIAHLRYVFILYALIALIIPAAVPAVIQQFVVQPNELSTELKYLQRTIVHTRAGFNLDTIDTQTFVPEATLSHAALLRNDLTVDNIRLWDTRPLLRTNQQLQQIRPYYTFVDADIDRYSLFNEQNIPEQQQVFISARELDYQLLPPQAQTWVNQHLVYTHGYGFTLSPVNRVAAGGLPDYFVKDITSASRDGALSANPAIRKLIPLANPRIYYGEVTNTYIMTGTKLPEFDHPGDTEDFYNTYDGLGGVPVNSWLRRLAFAQVLRDWQMLLTQNFTPQTKLLFHRSIGDRVRRIAPFLRYDHDPYLVVANTKQYPKGTTPSYLYWVIDAYTTSDHYPYSDPGAQGFNYIRNSVKVIVNAYNGNVTFYVADPNDPVIRMWQSLFRNLFKPWEEIPTVLQGHLRYPLDLVNIQSERLLSYHMTDPRVFYNREDQWKIPSEIYGGESQSVKPYYVTMKLPAGQREEFITVLPFTPNRRNNLIAWLAARSDGNNYGKLLLYQFPKQELVFGPEQIEARINQDPLISQQISLWNREGSRVVQGNLLVIPMEQSLLYVEPLYLEAEQNSLPTLVRVIVAYEEKIAMASSLDAALNQIFPAPS